MITLYHNAASTCSQKVRLVLAEKGLDFESHEIDLIAGEQHDPAYVKLNPNHVVPTLVHDDRVLLESTLIVRYLDEVFAEPPLRPADPYGRYEDDLWMKRIDEKVHTAAPVLTFAIGARNVLLQQPEAVREANIAGIPDPKKRAERRSVIEHGVRAPEFAGATRAFVDALDAMEETLSGRPWLDGAAPGLADCSMLPYVLRLDHLAISPLYADARRPAVADWYARWQARETYASAVTGWLPAVVGQVMRKSGEAVWPEVQGVIAEIERGA